MCGAGCRTGRISMSAGMRCALARDVDAALRDIAMKQGGLDEDQARDWVAALARQGRYLRDVY